MADIRDILKRFDPDKPNSGGFTAVANALRLRPSTVHGWVRNDHIPAWRQRELLTLAHERGVALSPTEFPSRPEKVA